MKASVRYWRAVAITPAVLAPQLLFLAAVALSEDLVFVYDLSGDGGRFAIVVVVAMVVGMVMASSIFAWLEKDDSVTARCLLAVAALSTALSAIGIGAGYVVVGLAPVSGLFFLMSLPILALAVWNARTLRRRIAGRSEPPL